MDNFREWLSDNLRYIMLGLGIVLVLALLFFGIRFVTNKLNEDEAGKLPAVESQNPGSGGEPTPQVTATLTPTEEPASTPVANTLEKSAYPEVNALMNTYYTALGNKDINAIRGVLDGFTEEDGQLITSSDYIQGYKNVVTYTKKGMKDGEYVVFATYDLKFVNITTLAPGLSQLYVYKAEDGSYRISGESEEIQTYVEKICQDEDVKALIQEVQLRANASREADKALDTFMKNLGI